MSQGSRQGRNVILLYPHGGHNTTSTQYQLASGTATVISGLRFLSCHLRAVPFLLPLPFCTFHCFAVPVPSALSYYFFISLFPLGNSNFEERMEIFQQLTENWHLEKLVDPTTFVGTGNFLKAGRMLVFPFALRGRHESVFRGRIRRISRLYFNKGRRLNEIYFLCVLHLLPCCSFSQNDHFLTTSTTIWPLTSAEQSHCSLNDPLVILDC